MFGVPTLVGSPANFSLPLLFRFQKTEVCWTVSSERNRRWQPGWSATKGPLPEKTRTPRLRSVLPMFWPGIFFSEVLPASYFQDSVSFRHFQIFNRVLWVNYQYTPCSSRLALSCSSCFVVLFFFTTEQEEQAGRRGTRRAFRDISIFTKSNFS